MLSLHHTPKLSISMVISPYEENRFYEILDFEDRLDFGGSISSLKDLETHNLKKYIKKRIEQNKPFKHQKPTREFLDSTRLKTQKYPSTVCSDICPPYLFYLLFLSKCSHRFYHLKSLSRESTKLICME